MAQLQWFEVSSLTSHDRAGAREFAARLVPHVIQRYGARHAQVPFSKKVVPLSVCQEGLDPPPSLLATSFLLRVDCVRAFVHVQEWRTRGETVLLCRSCCTPDRQRCTAISSTPGSSGDGLEQVYSIVRNDPRFIHTARSSIISSQSSIGAYRGLPCTVRPFSNRPSSLCGTAHRLRTSSVRLGRCSFPLLWLLVASIKAGRWKTTLAFLSVAKGGPLSSTIIFMACIVIACEHMYHMRRLFYPAGLIVCQRETTRAMSNTGM
jgi:hypothetical protein